MRVRTCIGTCPFSGPCCRHSRARIDLEVFSSNQAAIALYRRYGFTIEGRRRKARHVDGLWDDIILMALEPGEIPAPNNSIIRRIERQAAIPGLVAALANLSAPDLQSLLLDVYRQQAARRTPAAILAEHSRNRFTRPSQGGPRAFAKLERLAHENLPQDLEALELSPVCPLATCSGIAAVGQDWSVATIRNTEVVSDPTNVLALECALRRSSSAGRGYYRDFCMKIYAQTPEGEWIELGDGGSVDWTQRLLSNSKERLVTSGIGSERVCTLFASS
jgi:hypothetical protein